MFKKFDLSYIEEQIKFWQLSKEIWSRCDISSDDDVNTCIYKLYFRLRDVNKVLSEINKLGFRLPGKRKESIIYKSEDIKNSLLNAEIQDKELQNIVRKLSDINRKNSPF